MTNPTLHAIGNAHIDPVWLWRWPEGLETIRSTFQSVLDRMDEYPDFVFTGSSAAFYAWLRDTDPALFEKVKARVREGRWEIVGGWWVQPDANIPCGESLARQSLYGQRFFQEAFGVMATIGYNPDTFGHSAVMPQILRLSGMSRYVFMRPGPHEKDLPGNVFWWQAPDGSRVLTARISRSYGTWADELGEHVEAANAARPGYVSDYIVFYGVGNHGGGPTKANIDSIHAMSEQAGNPHIALSTLDAFFASVEAEAAAGAAIPVVADELQHHARGCYAAESEVKRHNRRVEHLLMNAERFCALATALTGRPYPRAELTSAWQAALFNQFHDILAGSSLPEAYVDARDGYGYSATIAARALNMAIQAISSRIDTRGEGTALVVFNPLPWPAKVPVEVERSAPAIHSAEGAPITGQSIQPTTVVGQTRVCFVAELPALGYRVFRQDAQPNIIIPPERAIPETPLPSLVARSATTTGLENAFWRLEVDTATGSMIRLFDKRNRVEALAGPANIGLVIEDRSDTWSHDARAFRDEVGRFSHAIVTVEEDGPVRAALRVEMHWGRSTLLQRLYLYREIDLIECRLSVNWQEQHKLLKLAFPLALSEPRATYETPYGSVARACNGEEEPGQQWLDVSGWALDAAGARVPYGVSLLNDSKYSFDVMNAEMRMTVLRSPVYAHHDPWKLEPGRAYVYHDQGWQSVTYRLVPHRGSWGEAGVPRRAWELNAPPVSVNEANHAGALPLSFSYLSVEPKNILLSVCKLAEDSDDLIVRGYETDGRPVRATLRMGGAGMTWEADFGAHEIKSWRISRNGATEEVDLLERKRL